VWAASWPKLAAAALLLVAWQTVVWLHLKESWVLPGPAPVLTDFFKSIRSGTLVSAAAVTLRRAAYGYAIAVVVGAVLGAIVARNRVLRVATGSLITGLQTMPTIAWFPFAILLFGLSETAIMFVVVLGAGPAIANGVISGVDHIPPILLRAGRVLGARGLASYRHVILPASLPGFVSGLKQGWAFAWRSLMAGELIVIIAKRQSLGVKLQYARENSDAVGLLATMVAVLLVGMLVDGMVFGRLDHAIRKRWGLTDTRA
jgi:NitT/TauT family transport system permease protein